MASLGFQSGVSEVLGYAKFHVRLGMCGGVVWRRWVWCSVLGGVMQCAVVQCGMVCCTVVRCDMVW